MQRREITDSRSKEEEYILVQCAPSGTLKQVAGSVNVLYRSFHTLRESEEREAQHVVRAGGSFNARTPKVEIMVLSAADNQDQECASRHLD